MFTGKPSTSFGLVVSGKLAISGVDIIEKNGAVHRNPKEQGALDISETIRLYFLKIIDNINVFNIKYFQIIL
jgi:hypothetical protein